MLNYRVLANIACQHCRIVGISTWTRDCTLMTDRKVLISVSGTFLKVGNEPYCGQCLMPAELIGLPVAQTSQPQTT